MKKGYVLTVLCLAACQQAPDDMAVDCRDPKTGAQVTLVKGKLTNRVLHIPGNYITGDYVMPDGRTQRIGPEFVEANCWNPRRLTGADHGDR